MTFLRRKLEQLISSITGSWVTFGGFRFSPMSGRIEVSQLQIAPDRTSVPVLTIDRVEAFVAVTRALKGEIVITRISIERPTLLVSLTLARRSEPPAPPPPPRPEPGQSNEPPEPGKWEFVTDEVTLTGGQIELRDARHEGYLVSLDGIDLTLTQRGQEIEVVMPGASLARRDQPVDLGQVHLIGKLTGGRLNNLRSASLNAQVSIGETIAVRIKSGPLAQREFSVDFAGEIDLATLISMLPDSILPLGHVRVDGQAEIRGECSLSLATGQAIVRKFELKLGEANFGWR